MLTQSENTKRIAKNTLMLYIRMLFGMLVSLYTSRIVLNALGVEDYGIYNVVGGFVAMFSLVSSSLSASVSRFLTFELGRGNMDRLKRVFTTSVSIHVVFESPSDNTHRSPLCRQLGISGISPLFHVRTV